MKPLSVITFAIILEPTKKEMAGDLANPTGMSYWGKPHISVVTVTDENVYQNGQKCTNESTKLYRMRKKIAHFQESSKFELLPIMKITHLL